LVERSKEDIESRPFNCVTCPKKVQKLRRCGEDKWDFEFEDASVFPMQIQKGGETYGFCPGKATWDLETKHVFALLMCTAEIGALYQAGGLVDQPEWYLDLLQFFLPAYDRIKFMSKAKMILGDVKKPKHPHHAKGAR